MSGYANRTLRQDFPELVADGDECYVVIRNPKTLPEAMLMPREIKRRKDEHGDKTVDLKDARRAGAELIASIVLDWRVYDATDFNEEPRLLDACTSESINKVPIEVTNWIGQQIQDARDPQ